MTYNGKLVLLGVAWNLSEANLGADARYETRLFQVKNEQTREQW